MSETGETKQTPAYDHDCELCQFVGQLDQSDLPQLRGYNSADVYVCKNAACMQGGASGLATVIVRVSSSPDGFYARELPEDRWAVYARIGVSPTDAAARMAIERGFLPSEPKTPETAKSILRRDDMAEWEMALIRKRQEEAASAA